MKCQYRLETVLQDTVESIPWTVEALTPIYYDVVYNSVAATASTQDNYFAVY